MLNYDFDFKCSMPKVQNNFKLPLQKSLLIKSADVFEIACPNNSVKRRKTLSRLDRIFFLKKGFFFYGLKFAEISKPK